MHQELNRAPLLIVSNKTDSSGSLPLSTVIDLMGLDRLDGRVWAIKECSTQTGLGVQVGGALYFIKQFYLLYMRQGVVNWITNEIRRKKQ